MGELSLLRAFSLTAIYKATNVELFLNNLDE